MHHRILWLVALIFFRCALAAEVPVQLEPFEVKGQIVPRSYPYNAFLGLADYHGKHASGRYEFVGFGFTKSPRSTYPQPLRVLVQGDDGWARDITNAEGVYVALPDLKGRKIRTNQPIGTVRAHAVLRLRAGWREAEWSGRTLAALMSDFNKLARKNDLSVLRSPVSMLTDALTASFSDANEVIVESSDPAALASLHQQTGGTLQGQALRLSRADLKRLPSAWRLDAGKIDRIYPWRSGVTPAYANHSDTIWYPLKFAPRLSSVVGGLLKLASDDLSTLNLYASYSLDDWDKVWK